MLETRYFSLNVESAGYIIERDGDNEGFGWTAREHDYEFDPISLPSLWENMWVAVDRDGDSVGVFVDRDVLGSLVGQSNVTHAEWSFSFDGKRFYDIAALLPDIVWHVTYKRRSRREREVAERSASMLEWLLGFYRDGTGIEVLDACKMVNNPYAPVSYGYRADAIRDNVDYSGHDSGMVDERVVLA